MRLVPFALLVFLAGCQSDPQAEIRERWAADSARYVGLDCGIVPLNEADECRRVQRVASRQAREARRATRARYARPYSPHSPREKRAADDTMSLADRLMETLEDTLATAD
jgi:hypothetical protein